MDGPVGNSDDYTLFARFLPGKLGLTAFFWAGPSFVDAGTQCSL